MRSPSPYPLPERLRARWPGWSPRIAWSRHPDSSVWRLERGAEIRYLKIAAPDGSPPLRAEADRLRWAAGRLPVPALIEHGVEAGCEWLLTTALPGRPAVDPELMGDPAALVPRLARALRAFHETPAADCPFRFDLDRALPAVRARVAAGLVDPARHLHAEFEALGVVGALAELEAMRPESEDLVLCHGDYCLPNILFTEGGSGGFVDLGELGVADRWWDLAVATWSLDWNLGPGWEAAFLAAYGVQPDPGRTRYFRLLYDLAS